MFYGAAKFLLELEQPACSCMLDRFIWSASTHLGRRTYRIRDAGVHLPERPVRLVHGVAPTGADRIDELARVGLATFMSDPIFNLDLISRTFDGHATGLTRDDILDNVTYFWLTNTAVSAARLYRENKFNYFAPKGVTIPAHLPLGHRGAWLTHCCG